MRTVCSITAKLRALHLLARAHGVLTSYRDMAKQRRVASPRSLLSTLRALGTEVHRLSDAPTALRATRLAQARQVLPPVVVAWEGRGEAIALRLPDAAISARATMTLELEHGEQRRQDLRLDRLPVAGAERVEGERYSTRKVRMPGVLPLGYHRLRVETSAGLSECLLVVAPGTAYSRRSSSKRWGVFLPLYALHANNGLGSGDLGDLRRLMGWTASQGGSLVGTLPLLPAFLDEPFEPSPYSPVSRLMWNEFYLDLSGIPEMARCRKARKLLRSPRFVDAVEALRARSLVDYRRQMALKREVIEALAESFFTRPSARRGEFDNFCREHPLVEDYARFRATLERQQVPWRQWPERMRNGALREGDYEEAAFRYHLYAQWQAHLQMASLAEVAGQRGVELYLDLPLGVHPDGFDVWRKPEAFALDAHGGAPPDPVFTKGQDWGFAPLHPHRLCDQGYRYFIDVLRHHLRHTGLLRIDHVMGLHRLYWIPEGLPASEGTYVRYQADELWAILCLESQRHRAMIVGENLGTVPPEVNRRMTRHRVRGTYVVQYELQPQPKRPLWPVPARSVAGLNTHDMPPFSAFWQGLDLLDRCELGWLKRKELPAEQSRRERMKRALVRWLRRRRLLAQPRPDAKAVLEGSLRLLAASPADVLLLNLEDLWLETAPQNTPGTTHERVNWCRKARLSLEQIESSAEVRTLFRSIGRLRRRR